MHTLPIAGGQAQVVELPTRVCVDQTRVVDDARCRGAPDRGRPFERKPEAPGLDETVPTIEAPELPVPEGAAAGPSFGERDPAARERLSR